MTTEELFALLVKESKPSLRKLLKPTKLKVLRITSGSWKARHTVKRLHRELVKRKGHELTEPKMLLFIDSTRLISALQRKGTKGRQCIAALGYLMRYGAKSGIYLVMRVQEQKPLEGLEPPVFKLRKARRPLPSLLPRSNPLPEPERGKLTLPGLQPVEILGKTGSRKGAPLSEAKGEEQPSQACLGMGHRFDLSPKPVPKIELRGIDPMDPSFTLHHSIIGRTGSGRGGPVR